MIKHIVLFTIKENAEGKSRKENMEIMKNLLMGLKNKISVIKSIEVGINADNADQSNYHIAIDSTFASIEDLQAYVVHPDHKEVAAYIGKIKETRACIDYEI